MACGVSLHQAPPAACGPAPHASAHAVPPGQERACEGAPPKGAPSQAARGPPARPAAAATTSALLESSLAQLSVSNLSSLCQRLKVQLIQQRLPLICPACKPTLVASFKMEVNLTQMLRVLCKPCRALFRSNKRFKSKKAGDISTTTVTACRAPPRTAEPPAGGRIEKIIIKTGAIHAGGCKAAPLALPSAYGREALYKVLAGIGASWCRVCGSTVCGGGGGGSDAPAWRPGPWGPETLCVKHGNAYAGLNGMQPLNLDAYLGEAPGERVRPVIQTFCATCTSSLAPPVAQEEAHLYCFGCPKAFHAACGSQDNPQRAPMCREGGVLAGHFFCSPSCPANYAALIAAAVKDAAARRTLAAPAQRAPKGVVTVAVVTEQPTPKAAFHGATAAIEQAAAVGGAGAAHRRPYAKCFPAMAGLSPLTPPPTPPTTAGQSRKRRAASAFSGSRADFLVSFEPEAALINRPRSAPREHLYTPLYRAVPFPPQAVCVEGDEASLREATVIGRHARYEAVEKTQRLLRPAILRSLFRDAATASLLPEEPAAACNREDASTAPASSI